MPLKSIVQTEEYREIEAIFKREAVKIKNQKIDRKKTYEEQGRENHVNR